MAKEIVKKKQRVAHNKTFNEDHKLFPECQDFLASIMEGMDSNNLEAAHSNKSDQKFSDIWNFSIPEKMQNNANPSTNQNQVNLLKSKKFGVSRKFPLMEKSQRALKQIKHNRQMPKPMAHLAWTSASVEKPQKDKVITKVAKNTNKFQHKMPEELMQSMVVAVNGSNTKKSLMKEPSKVPSKLQSCTVKNGCSVPETTLIKSTTKVYESSITKDSVKEASHSEDKNCVRTGDNSSDSDEYEKFIKREKKTLPKKSKSVKNNRKSVKKSVSKERGSKTVVKSVPMERESDVSDEWNEEEETASLKSDHKRNKRMKKAHKDDKQPICKKDCRSEYIKVKRKCTSTTNFKSALPKSDSEESDNETLVKSYYKQNKRSRSQKVLNTKQSISSKEDSESEMDINDETHHNSSSESDDLPPLSELIDHTPSSNKTHDNQFSGKTGNDNNSVMEFISSSDKTLVNNTPLINDQSMDMLNAKPLYKNTFNTTVEPSSVCVKVPSHQASSVPSLLSNDQTTTRLKSRIHLLEGSSLPAISNQISSLVISNNQPKKENVISKNNIEVNTSCKQENSNKSRIVDLTESDRIVKVEPSSSLQTSGVSSLLSNDQSITRLKSGIHPLVGSALSNVSDKRFSVMGNDQNKKESVNSKNNILINSSCKQENSNKSLIVDLTESDNECESSFTVMPKIVTASSQKQIDSDESDIELIDVRAPYLPKKPTCLNKSAKPDLSKGSESKVGIKTENVDKTVPNTIAIPQNTLKSNPEFQTSLIGKYEVAYSTGICQGTDNKKDEIKQLNLNNDRLQNAKKDAENSLDLNKVKQEPLDDCVIVLDTSTSNSTLNLPNVQFNSNNKSVKVEKDSKVIEQVHLPCNTSIVSGENKFVEKEQKLHEIACSNLKNISNTYSQNSESLENEGMSALNIKVLLENLKQEFSTYQDILQTEQSVEATFKMLEKVQAEKLMSLRSKITQLLESVPSNTACSNSLKHAMKLLDHSELNSPLSVKDCDQQSAISVQDLKTFASMNLVPLSSISANDIKPNLSELQQAIKQEPSISDEINSIESFGEKCIVCTKDASAACQQCAKVFFCSHECGRTYWDAGHKDTCVK